MANVEIIIKISEDDLDCIKYLKVKGWASKHELLILKGTQLPKGHGRLGDLDALEQEITNGIKAGDYEEGYEKYAHINNIDDCVDCVRYADTIIKADKR